MSTQYYVYTLKEGWLEVDELVKVEPGLQFDFRYFNMPSELHIFYFDNIRENRFRVMAGLGDAGIDYEVTGLLALAASIRDLAPLLNIEWSHEDRITQKRRPVPKLPKRKG
jgi:hypothetical protein